VCWPLLSTQDWIELKELCPFLELFKELTLYFSKTTECRMSDVCLDFEDLLVDIKLKYIDKKEQISDRLWYAANAAYTKLTKYYTKINSENFAIATVLDPRYKLDVYDSTQDPVALKASAKVAIKNAFERYSLKFGAQFQNSVVATPLTVKKRKRFANNDNGPKDELTIYLEERRSNDYEKPLEYWKLNKTRFPILAVMARDYLALQPTSKDVEGNFSKGRRTIPYYRRSQNASSIRNQMLVNSGFNLGVFS
jgi:hypothetical protein